MPQNTNIAAGGLVSFKVKVDGKEIDSSIEIDHIKVHQGVNKVSNAQIALYDGRIGQEQLQISSSTTFLPGNKVTIEAGYDEVYKIIFQGIITKQSIKINDKGMMLMVECKDELIKTTVGRKSKTFYEMTDSEVISSILGNYSGISSAVATTSTKWSEQVQYYSTDWDFILSRAESNGLIVSNINNVVHVKEYQEDTRSVLTIEYGDNLLRFDGELNAEHQYRSVKASTWDYKTQQLIDAESTSQYEGPGNLSSRTLSEVLELKDYPLQTPANLNKEDLSVWSKSQMIKSNFSKIRSEVSMIGNADVFPTQFVTLKGLGDRFDGDHFVSHVDHVIEEGYWTTFLTLGVSNRWITEDVDVMAPPTAGLLPGTRGLFNATVIKMHDDPDQEFRILIDIPLFDPSGKGIWARLSNFYSSNGVGAFFLPEVGDEVVVGFLNEDPRYPIILGSLYSSHNKPYSSMSADGKNSKKAIVTRSNITLEFDDEDKVLTIQTPSKNTITLNDQSKEIEIKDQNENRITMSSSGIVIKSHKSLDIESSQKVTIKGDQGVDIRSSGGDVNINGLNIKADASVSCEMNGGATAKVEGGMDLTLRAAMIKIN